MTSTPESSLTKPKAVVVVDDQTVAGMICYFLELQGITCLHAVTAESGWPMLSGQRPAMAVIDQRLPDRDGWWLLERIRHDEGLARLPVVLITGYQETDVAAEAQQLGCGCLPKPFSYDELNDQLAEAGALAEGWKRE